MFHRMAKDSYKVKIATVEGENGTKDIVFALFFGGWPYDGGDAPEMVIAVVSGENTKVVYSRFQPKVENRRTRLMREEARRYLRHEGK